ncbi:MAG: hypothetical protein KDD53_02775, partial [Bdellovibrionales bacterium]|nr:hypothetical protein [Bdellovibrionales bacterium]
MANTVPSSSYSKRRMSLSSDGLCIAFGFDPKRFEILKKFRKVRFDKSQKVWRVPFIVVPELIKLKLFELDSFSIDFTLEELLERVENAILETREALNRLTLNPLSVSSRDIELCQPDYI